MANRCEPGDIAVIIYEEPGCINNVGRLVRVHPTLKVNPEYQLPCWIIEPLQDDPWCLSGSDGSICTRRINLQDSIEHPDAWMLPIKVNIISAEELAAYNRIQERIDQDLVLIGAVLSNSNGGDHV